MTNDYFRDAYLRTTYIVQTGRGPIEIRVGGLNSDLDQFLAEQGMVQWAFITASNPMSSVLSDEDNQRRHGEIIGRVVELGYRALEGSGQGYGTAWPPERSLMILGIDRDNAIDLAAKFGQRAILVGRVNELPELLMLA